MGSDTSISDQRTVSNPPINPPVINPGPPNWVVLPWTSGQTKSVIWSATNADSCVVTATTPSGVTTQQFLGGITSCLSTGCGNANALTLAAPVAGQYSATVTCSKTGVADVLSTNSWTVTQNSSATCLNPSPNWNRVESAPIYYQGSTSGFNQGVKDVTAYDSIWGRAYNVSGDPITKQWPGVEQQLVLPRFGNLQYIAAKFRTPAAGGTPGHTLTLDPTSFSANGGGNPSFPNKAKLSITVSTKCGDFNTASPDIPPLCYKSQMGANATFSAYTSVPSSQCSLQPNTDYYLNIIYSPLTSPATAVFNGNNGGVSLLQNTGVIP